MIHLPAGKVRTADVPLLALAVGGQDKGAFLGADENADGGHGIDPFRDFEFAFVLKINFFKGITNIFCTDISKDGLLQGPSVELYKKIMNEIPELKLIASGGVSEMKDVTELEKIGCRGVIIGKAIYEGRITIDELKNYINAN